MQIMTKKNHEKGLEKTKNNQDRVMVGFLIVVTEHAHRFTQTGCY